MFTHRVLDDLELRLLQPYHAEELYTLVDRNRAYLRQWMGWVDDTVSAESTRHFISGALRHFAESQGFQLGLWYREQLAGTIGIVYLDRHHQRAEFGYWLAELLQGKGLMTAACRALLTHLFSTLQLHRVELRIATANHRSRAIADRLGFHHEGTLREAFRLSDRFLDMELYALLRRDWEGLS